MAANQTLNTGKYRFRFCSSPHIPYGWDAGVLFEESQRNKGKSFDHENFATALRRRLAVESE